MCAASLQTNPHRLPVTTPPSSCYAPLMTKKGNRGGARPGAGRPPGSRTKTALEKLRNSQQTIDVLQPDEIVELARDRAPEALTQLVLIMRDKRVSGAARVAAAKTILGYAAGKPRAMDSTNGKTGAWIPAKLISIDDAEFEVLEPVRPDAPKSH